MRVLKFVVEGQIIKRDGRCDFSNIVAGTSGYLVANFAFSEVWNGCAKVVEFLSESGEELDALVINRDNSCNIPDNVSKKHAFYIKIYGKRDGYIITTNKILIKQYGGEK